MGRKKITIYPSIVEDINAAEEIKEIPNLGNPKCMKRGCCVHPRDKRYYHPWLNLQELTHGGKAQCGYPATHNCNYNIYYDIKGYRNTCPIAGCNGTFHTPALLKLAGFNFEEKGIKEGATIHSITVEFEHRCSGVDVGNGKQHYNWGPNFTSTSVSTPRIYCIKGAKGKEVPLTDELIGNNPPISTKYKGTGGTLTSDKLTSDNILSDDFAIYIRYGPNLNTNPGIIFLQGLKITVEFTNINPVIMPFKKSTDVYANDSKHCSSTLMQFVSAGYINFNGIIEEGDDSESLVSNIKLDKNSLPSGVSVVDEYIVDDKYKVFKFKDNSDVAGEKNIRYYLDIYPETDVLIPYDAKILQKPNIKIQNQYLKDDNLELYEEGEEYISAYDGCCDFINVYFDKVIDEPDLQLDVLKDFDGTGNILINDGNYTNMKKWYSAVAHQSCGTHTAWFQRSYWDKNGQRILEDINKAKIINYSVNGQNIQFKIYDPDNQDLKYIQDKNPATQYQEIKIQRIDSQPLTDAKVTIYDETNPDKTIIVGEDGTDTSFKKNEIKTIKINKYYAGQYHVRVENRSQEGCSINPSEELITITANHRQYHDKISIRGEDSTSFNYDYLVAWEGDNVHSPINIDSTHIGRSFDDIRLCSNDAQTGLSELGIATLKVSNTTTDDLTNIRIELNTLKEEDGNKLQTTDEWVVRGGMFYNFYNNFNDVNREITNIVSVENLTPDNDLVGEENVYILIKRLPAKEQIEIKIPFEGTSEKEILLQYLIFEEPQTLYYPNCQTQIPVNYIRLNIYDSLLTMLDITGDNDLLMMDKSTCPQRCYRHTDGEKNPDKPYDNPYAPLTYKITNIDSSSFEENELAPFVIKNSIEVDPYRILDKKGNIIYEKNASGEETYSSDRIKINRKDNIEIKSLSNQIVSAYVNYPQLEEQIIKGRTDKNGEVTFYIDIPETLGDTYYSIEELFNNFLHIEYEGDLIYNSSIIQGNVTPIDTVLRYSRFFYKNKEYAYANRNITIKAGDTFRLVGYFGYKEDISDYDDNILEVVQHILNRPLYLYRRIDGEWKKIQTLITSKYDGTYNFEFSIKNTSKEDKSLAEIMLDIGLVFKGDTLYNGSVINYTGDSIIDNKKTTKLQYFDDWRSYKTGTTAAIKVKLESYETVMTNEITFDASIIDPGDSDSITVYYKMCNLKDYNCYTSKDNYDKIYRCELYKGIFSTSLETNSYKLITNKTELPIYCGIISDFDIKAKLESKVIESSKVNVIYITVENKIKYNKDVNLEIDLGQIISDNYLGDYTYLSINNDDGDYAINTEIGDNDNENVIISWKIGDMEPYTTSKATIKIKADDIGLSDIRIFGYDYLHTKGTDDDLSNIGKDLCGSECDKE